MRPQTMTPTTRDAITAPIHSCRLKSASGVIPRGHPRDNASDQLHPLRDTVSTPSMPASTGNRSRRKPAERLPNKPCEQPGPRDVTVAPPESQAGPTPLIPCSRGLSADSHVEYYAA